MSAIKDAVVASLTEELRDLNRFHNRDDEDSVFDTEGDIIGGLRDHIEQTTLLDNLPSEALAEVASAWVAGYQHGTAEFGAAKRVWPALRRAGLRV
jgi:hypothetical protein